MAIDTLCSLRAKFPACFASSRQPLKLKIHLDILAAAPEIDPINIGRALKLYTGHVGYLRECVGGRARIDLNGRPAGTVSTSEAKHAAELVAKIKDRSRREAQPITPPRLSLADLKTAAAARKRAIAGGAP